MSHILAKSLIVIVAITYSALAIPLIVWAFNPQLGVALVGGMMSALGRVPKRVLSLISCVKGATPLEGRKHGSKISEERAHR